MPLSNRFLALRNFELAFERLVRGQNRDYKSFFRHLYPSYQLALRENLEDLTGDIKTGKYTPSPATSIYQPKKSGILRPLRLLNLQDQIVYQAIANVIAEAFRLDQSKYALTRNFGAIVASKSSQFFFRGWKNCYRAFDAAIVKAYNRGNCYVADFDLVSFYELIDHTLLRDVLERRVKSPELLDLLFQCLEKWTENDRGGWLGHGIPQGPEPSAFLAECFLFPFDAMKFKDVVYLRYVDDIKLMAKDEIPVRRGLLRLDIASKHVGLVPQAQKIECRKVSSLNELRKNVPSNVLSLRTDAPISSSSHKRLERMFRASITKESGVWVIKDATKFKFALFRMNPTRAILRRVGQILPHRPDLSPVFASYLMKFPADKEAADILLAALRRDPTYDSSAADYIEAMDVCEPNTGEISYRRVIQTAEKRSEEKSILLDIAAATFRGRRSGTKDALKLIAKQKHPLARSVLLHRLFGDDSQAPFKPEQGQSFIEEQTKSPDSDLARYSASRLIDFWPWSEKSWNPSKDVNNSVKLLLKSVGLRKKGPNKIGILDRFFKDRQKIGINISWRKALGKDWRDAESRCLRLQEFEIGDPSSWVCMLDTFNEVLVQNFSRSHPVISAAFSRATPPRKANPDYGAWLNQNDLNAVIPVSKSWFLRSSQYSRESRHCPCEKWQGEKYTICYLPPARDPLKRCPVSLGSTHSRVETSFITEMMNELHHTEKAVNLVQDASPASRIRYRVLALAVLLAGITYLDRVCISLTAPAMMRDLGLSKVEMSLVFSAFTLAYGIFEIPTGWWGDRIGTRRVLTRIVIWWSSFTIFTAGVFNYASLLVIRFLFGAGEAGAWPNAAKTFSRWFPVTERGTAQGIFFMGAHLAGGLTPLLVTAMLGRMHWRWVFVVFGAVGFVWAAVWFWWFRDEPEQHKAVSPAELAHIQRGRGKVVSHHLSAAAWKRILTNRSLLALCLAYFTQTYGFYFFITWMPTYLENARGFTSTMLGVMAGLPLVMSAAADLFGGLTTDWATKRFGLRVGRCGVGSVCYLVASVLLIVGTATQHNITAVVLISLALASSNFLLGASWSACTDIAGDHAGTVSACMNTAGQVGGFLSPIVAALFVQKYGSWSAPLYVCGGLYFLGALCWWLVNPQRPIVMED